jgi:hypothetical protein
MVFIPGCRLDPPKLGSDLEAPSVWAISLGPPDDSGLSSGVDPGGPIQVLFSEPLDAMTVNPQTVAVVFSSPARPCVRAPDCPPAGDDLPGICMDGGCREVGADDKLIRTMADPDEDLSDAPGVVDVEVSLDEGTMLTVQPVERLAPNGLYSLVLSERILDRAGNGLVGPDDVSATLVYHFVTANPTEGCRRLRLVSPVGGDGEVPRNLPEIVVSSDGALGHASLSGVELTVDGSLGNVLAYGVAAPGRCGPDVDGVGRCYRFPVKRVLAPNTTYELALTERASDPRSPGCAALSWDEVGWFSTGSIADTVPPQVGVTGLTVEGSCLVASISASEPSTLSASLCPAADGCGAGPLGEWSGGPAMLSHRVRMDLDGMEPGQPVVLEVRGRDLVGLVGETVSPAVAVPPPSAAVVITEVLANPNGPEPDQEMVEILNASDGAVDLAGWSISDRLDDLGDELPETELPAKSFGVIVGSGYDPSQGEDPGPDPGATMVRLESSIASNGLSNSGEPVFLFDSDGRLVSSFHPVGSPGPEGCSTERTGTDPCAEGAGWELNTAASSTPGWENSMW